jgi:hypothetical protein
MGFVNFVPTSSLRGHMLQRQCVADSDCSFIVAHQFRYLAGAHITQLCEATLASCAISATR